MNILSLTVAVFLTATPAAFGQGDEAGRIAEYGKTLPTIGPPTFDEAARETLADYAIGCTDHPQEAPGTHEDYLWPLAQPPRLLDTYEKTRAFYGCSDWHGAVGSIWTLLSLLKDDPTIRLASDIKDIAATHLQKSNIEGELGFFNGQMSPYGSFEKPYGYAWLLKLYGEVKGSSTGEDKRIAAVLAPLAKWMSERYVFYLYDLKFPYRYGSEINTAWSMSLALDGASLSEDSTLMTAIRANAVRLFEADKDCATNLEPGNADFVSSCLTEAALMGRVLDRQSYLRWLDAFLPAVYADTFQVYAKDVDISHVDASGPDAQIQLTAESRLIGLTFQRAVDLLTISYALPKDDPRVAVFTRLAAINAKRGYEKMGRAGYEGQHWLSTFALLYENAAKGPAPLRPPEKPRG